MTPERAPWRFRWIAVTYLLLVFVVAATTFLLLRGPVIGANLGGIWLIVATLPTSLLLMEIDLGDTGPSAYALLLIAGVAQAALLYALRLWLDKRR
ncbi:SCO4225 family membrane protein [Actinophytocola xinjiangensis]|uniref:SCO4225 family membrane protein n=1 Tax=Actinophytocola xinjiangensis TaxID=485602 RepID=UPI0012B88C2F|nr:hypothetical protein [Actinophytocola xinjiangensis]